MAENDFSSKSLGDDVPWGAKMAAHYDQQVRTLFPVYDEMMSMATKWFCPKMPETGKVLTLAPGTGEEICRLASLNPNWTFDGYDTSPDMLKIAESKLHARGFQDRVRLHLGSTAAMTGRDFAGATAMLVIHFLEDAPQGGKELALRQMRERVAKGSPLIYADFLGADPGDVAFESEFASMRVEAIARAANPEECEKIYLKARELVQWVTPPRLIEIAKESGWKCVEPIFHWHCLHAFGFVAE